MEHLGRLGPDKHLMVSGFRGERARTAAMMPSGLPDYYRDPFDRLLIAQTIDAGVELLTSDKALAVYSPLVRLV